MLPHRMQATRVPPFVTSSVALSSSSRQQEFMTSNTIHLPLREPNTQQPITRLESICKEIQAEYTKERCKIFNLRVSLREEEDTTARLKNDVQRLTECLRESEERNWRLKDDIQHLAECLRESKDRNWMLEGQHNTLSVQADVDLAQIQCNKQGSNE